LSGVLADSGRLQSMIMSFATHTMHDLTCEINYGYRCRLTPMPSNSLNGSTKPYEGTNREHFSKLHYQNGPVAQW